MISIFEKELLPNIKKYDVVLFGMGINNAFNAGLLYEIALNFPEVRKQENEKSPYGDRRKYGEILEVKTEGITFCACYVSNGGYCDKVAIQYDYLEKALNAAKKKYCGLKICAPIIGANYYDGRGDKTKIKSIFEKVFCDSSIDLYDYEQKDFKLEIFKKSNEAYSEYKNGNISKEEYELKKRELSWIKTNGIFKEMPADYTYKTNSDLIRVKKSDLEKN